MKILFFSNIAMEMNVAFYPKEKVRKILKNDLQIAKFGHPRFTSIYLNAGKDDGANKPAICISR